LGAEATSEKIQRDDQHERHDLAASEYLAANAQPNHPDRVPAAPDISMYFRYAIRVIKPVTFWSLAHKTASPTGRHILVMGRGLIIGLDAWDSTEMDCQYLAEAPL